MKIDFKKKPIIIFTGPSAVGKGTIEKTLFKFEELRLQLSCSATTRKPRVGEVDGVHYFFISKKEFEDKLKKDMFFEYSHHFDNYYGTLYEEIDRIHKEEKVPFLEIETNGARQILEKAKKEDKYHLITIFILPPTIKDLEDRIRNRNTEDEASIQKRLAKGVEEIKEKSLFKYQVVNDIPERAAEELREIIKKEIMK